MSIKENATTNKKKRKSSKPSRARMVIDGVPVGKLSGGTDGMCHKDDLPEIIVIHITPREIRERGEKAREALKGKNPFGSFET